MKEPKWILRKTVIHINNAQIAEHGGSPGIRDIGLLDSAVENPKHLFHYNSADLFELAAAYAIKLIKNHPFVDANKRVSYIITRLFLRLNGYDLSATKEEKIDIFIKLAAGEITEMDFASWLKTNCMKIS